MSDETGVVSLPLKDAPKLVGKFVVIYRNSTKTPSKILSVDMEAKRWKYEVLGGIDKGKIFSSNFDESQSVKVYDESNLVLALMDT